MLGEVQKCLVVSTKYISEETNNRVSRWCCDNTLTESIVHDYGYGFIFVYIPHMDDIKDIHEEFCEFLKDSPELFGLLKFAQDHDIQILKIDCDGDELLDLPKFDW